jgi:hypothetical protein
LQIVIERYGQAICGIESVTVEFHVSDDYVVEYHGSAGAVDSIAVWGFEKRKSFSFFFFFFLFLLMRRIILIVLFMFFSKKCCTWFCSVKEPRIEKKKKNVNLFLGRLINNSTTESLLGNDRA